MRKLFKIIVCPRRAEEARPGSRGHGAAFPCEYAARREGAANARAELYLLAPDRRSYPARPTAYALTELTPPPFSDAMYPPLDTDVLGGDGGFEDALAQTPPQSRACAVS